jgi:hypothetical protein
MIVFGGYDGTQSFNDGGIYDPFANSWTTLSTVNAPTLRNSGQGIWTGAKMIIWGSLIGNTSTNTGGLYDPIRDEWTVMTTTNAPLRRVSFNPLWTGRQMLVWSGLDYINNPGTLNTGGIYVP